eukprot:6197170-Pleurochrysis_carterae.AAC.1
MRSGPTSRVGAPELEALGAHPRRAPRSSMGVCSWRSQVPGALSLTLEVLEAYRAGGTDTTPTLRRGMSKPLISSTRPKTASSVRNPPPENA